MLRRTGAGLAVDRLAPRLVGPPPLLLRLLAVLTVPLVLYALLATGEKALEHYHLSQQAEGLRAEVGSLRQENLGLQQAILEARTDGSVEAIAREQLGLVRPGDQAVALVAPAGKPSKSSAPAAPASPQRPVWQQWWDHFVGEP